MLPKIKLLYGRVILDDANTLVRRSDHAIVKYIDSVCVALTVFLVLNVVTSFAIGTFQSLHNILARLAGYGSGCPSLDMTVP